MVTELTGLTSQAQPFVLRAQSLVLLVLQALPVPDERPLAYASVREHLKVAWVRCCT